MASHIGARYLRRLIVPAIESIEEFQEDSEFESQTLHGRRLLNALRLRVSCISCISFSSCL